MRFLLLFLLIIDINSLYTEVQIFNRSRRNAESGASGGQTSETPQSVLNESSVTKPGSNGLPSSQVNKKLPELNLIQGFHIKKLDGKFVVGIDFEDRLRIEMIENAVIVPKETDYNCYDEYIHIKYISNLTGTPEIDEAYMSDYWRLIEKWRNGTECIYYRKY